MLDFFKHHRFKILAAVLALLFGVMLYSASADGIRNIPRNLLMMVTTPFQKAGSWLSEEVGGFFDEFLNARQNAEENERLEATIAELRQQLIDYETLKDENEQLKAIAGIKEVHSDFEMADASVISRDPNDTCGSFMIDKGELHGIAVDDPVMTEQGLVGIVTEVGPTSARVQTILNPNSEVGAMENVTRELGIVQGDLKLSLSGEVKMSILSGETSIQPGDMIITAGSSGVYPQGIPIGTVKEVRDESHGVTKYAVLEPFEDMERVDSVIVITDFLGQGSERLDFSR